MVVKKTANYAELEQVKDKILEKKKDRNDR